MHGSKKCFKCLESKSIEEFYRHPRMGDGRLNKCKSCTKRDVSKHRSENIDAVRAYDRERGRLPERARAAATVSAEWRRQDSRRGAAHNAVARALRSGKILRQACSRCGGGKTYAHHESYDRKLDVTWLCQPCHKQRHKEMAMDGIDP